MYRIMKAKKNVKGLIKALHYQKKRYVRLAAAEALGEIGDARAVDPLIAVLQDDNEDVRRAAAEALGKIRDKRAVEPLLEIFKDSEVWWAAEALGELGDKRAVEPLIRVVNSRGSGMRPAMVALGKIGADNAADDAVDQILQVLNEVVNDKNVGEKTRCVAIDALGDIGDCRAIELLLKCLEDEVAEAATQALLKIGPTRIMENREAVEQLLNYLRGENRGASARAAIVLGNIGDTRVTEPLIQLLLNENLSEHVRENAAYALGKIGDVRAIAPLAKTLEGELTKNKKIEEEWAEEQKYKGVNRRFTHVSRLERETLEALLCMTDRSAIEPVIDWLFERSQEGACYLTLASSSYGGSGVKGIDRIKFFLQKFFSEDYVDMILEVSTYRLYGEPWDRRVSISESNEALQKLCATRNALSNNLLHKVAQREDRVVDWSYQYYEDAEFYIERLFHINYDEQRKTAKEELARRGNPPYDPSAYLDRTGKYL